MARRSLSSQIIEVEKRTSAILEGAKGIVDPMTAHMLDQALGGLREISELCRQSQRRSTNQVLSYTPLAAAFGDAPPKSKPTPRKTATRARKPAVKGAET